MRPLIAAPLLAFAFAPAAHAATVAVGTCLPALTSVPTIGQAIAAAGTKGIVKICPGTYAEQLTISKSLTLEGTSSNGNAQVLLIPPTGGLAANATDFDNNDQPTAAQIAVVGGATVNISNITVDGTGNGIGAYGCAWDVIGILYQNSSGTVSGTLVRNEFAAPFASFGGCQSGQGIFVQTAPNHTSNVVLKKNIVETYAKNGITGDDAGTSLTVTGNTVLGMGPTTGAAENSVQIAYGATGSITGNIVGDDVWQPDAFGDTGDAAAGILAYASSGVKISSNTVGSTQYGIVVVGDGNGDGDNASITQNKVNVTYLYDAVDVCGAGNATITGNTLNASDESAIHLDSSCGTPSTGNTVSGNVIDGACAGILAGTNSGPTTGTNTVTNTASAVVTGSDVCPVPTSNVASGKHRKATHFRPAR